MIFEGRVWKFGDGLKSSHFFNGKYDILTRQHKYDELAEHILEDHEDGMSAKIQPGDIFVVGESFGTGKHLWGPVGAFRALGVQAVFGKSFSTSWQRNSLNVGFLSVVYPEIYDLVSQGDVIKANLAEGTVENKTTGEHLEVAPLPDGIRELIQQGGIAELTKKRMAVS